MTIGFGKRLARGKGQNFFTMMPLVPRQTVRENDLNECVAPKDGVLGSCLFFANSLQCALPLSPFKFYHDEPWPYLFFLPVKCTNSTRVKLDFQGAEKAPQRPT